MPATVGLDTKDIVGLVIIGVIILALWLALLNVQKIVERGSGGPDDSDE